jgi:hypothetical protein
MWFYRSALPGLHIAIEAMIVAGERIVAHIIIAGAHQG